MHLAKTLREFRLRTGKTQAELAKATGGAVSASLIGHAEAGTRVIGTGRLELLATALGLSDDERAELRAARMDDIRTSSGAGHVAGCGGCWVFGLVGCRWVPVVLGEGWKMMDARSR